MSAEHSAVPATADLAPRLRAAANLGRVRAQAGVERGDVRAEARERWRGDDLARMTCQRAFDAHRHQAAPEPPAPPWHAVSYAEVVARRDALALRHRGERYRLLPFAARAAIDELLGEELRAEVAGPRQPAAADRRGAS